MCVCLCVYVFVYVSHHKDVGMEAMWSLDDSNFGGILHRSGMFAADGLSSTHTGHTLRSAMQLPSAAGAAFVTGSYPFPTKSSNLFVLHLSTPLFTTPLWVSSAGSWTRPSSRPPVATAFPVVYLARPDSHFNGQGAQQPLTPGLSGVGLASPPI